jgi:hypothetical protein
MQLLNNIEDWYFQEHHSYLRIYGATALLHFLPKQVSFEGNSLSNYIVWLQCITDKRQAQGIYPL